ncbi:hypothetical protein ANO11243_073110 [Dothideomycetidae sp. 11243]|nr:hypothetical protein ANO11243_073110 [fungal sp. No.11243]
MIQLNPLVINHIPCRPPPQASADEYHAVWYELTDRISYLPGVRGNVSYKACFHDLPRGLQTHIYAPAGLDIKEKWSIGGNEPGEKREVLELGLVGVPREGLYLREDLDMQCNVFLTNFVKKNLKKAHSVLVDRLVVKADLAEDSRTRSFYGSTNIGPSWPPSVKSGSSVYSAGEPSSPTNPQIPEMPGSELWPRTSESSGAYSNTSARTSSSTNIYAPYDPSAQPSPRFPVSPGMVGGGSAQQQQSPGYAPAPLNVRHSSGILPQTTYRPPSAHQQQIAGLPGEDRFTASGGAKYRPWRRDSSQLVEEKRNSLPGSGTARPTTYEFTW